MDKKLSTIPLQKWTLDLLNNQINSAKTSDNAVTLSFEELKKHMMEQKLHNETLIENYMKNHEIPRREKDFEYNTFLSDKERLFNEWKKTKELGKLHEYLHHKVPEKLQTSQDDIYTIYE
jgi:hypothetical protein